MTTPEHGALRELALRVLAQHAGDAGATALASAAHRAYDDLARAAARLIGQIGVDAVTGRALHLARRDYPWLAETLEPTTTDGPFAPVIFGLERQTPAVANAAAADVFAILTRLLVTFIGEPLTTGLLRQAWPDAFSDATIEET